MEGYCIRGVCVAAETNYHKRSSIKHHKFILSQFWRLEVQSKGVGAGLVPPGGPEGRSAVL